MYCRSPFIHQVFVYGDSLKSFPVAIVILDDAYVQKWAEKSEHQAIANDEEKFKAFILSEMIREGKKRDLMSYEQVKVIEIIKEPFTIENGLLTPTFKSRRFVVEKKYKDLLLSLYKKMKD